MYQRSKFFFIAAAGLFMVGCGDSHEKIAQDSVSQMKKMAAVLEKIESAADAISAKSQLDQIAVDLKAILARAKRIGPPKGDADASLKSQFDEKQKAVASRISQAYESLSQECKDILSGVVKVGSENNSE